MTREEAMAAIITAVACEELTCDDAINISGLAKEVYGRASQRISINFSRGDAVEWVSVRGQRAGQVHRGVIRNVGTKNATVKVDNVIWTVSVNMLRHCAEEKVA